MKAIETAHPGVDDPSPKMPSGGHANGSEAGRADPAALTGWLLEGRFFTVGSGGAVTTWSPAAAATFGWTRKDIVGSGFVETLIDAEDRDRADRQVTGVLDGTGGPDSGFTGEVGAVTNAGDPLRAAFAVVPIQIRVGYEFNSTLQELASRSTDAHSLAELKSREDSVFTLIDDALAGRHADPAADEPRRLAGALVVFDAHAGPSAQAPPANVVAIADAASVDETRAQLDTARRDAEEARVELRNIQGQLDEARREAQRARNEVDVARQEAGDARDALAVAQRESESVRSELDAARREGEEWRVSVETGRIRLEEAVHESETLRRQLLEARDQARGSSDRVEAELARAREEAERSLAELAEARRELGRHSGEAEAARARADAALEELGELRSQATGAASELDRARADLDHARAAADRLSEQLRAREAELGELRVELQALQGGSAGLGAELAAERSQLQAARAELERLHGELGRIRGERDEGRSESARLASELERSAEAATDLRGELGKSRAEADGLRGRLDTASGELEASRSEVAGLRGQLEASRGELEASRGEVEGLRGQLEASRGELERRTSEGHGAGPVAPADSGELRAALDRMEQVFERSPVGGLVTAADGRILQANRALCETLGYPCERLVGDEPPAIIHPDDVEAKRQLARRMLLGEQAVARGYRRYVHADGHVIEMRENVSLVRDGHGDPLMFIFQLEEGAGREPGDRVVVDADVDHGDSVRDELGDGRGGESAAVVRQALDDDRFVLHCQPVLDLRVRAVSQYELLIRMVGDDGRLVLPQAFLAEASRAGLACEIDRWVVRQAFALLAADPDGEASLEVNLSADAIDDPELPALIEQELAVTPVDPGRLILEVSGATAIADLERTKDLAKRLRGLGCRFALDDFRSTFGSFRLLKDLPLDYLKLDGDLVGTLSESRTSQLIVKALVDVAAGTGTKTVAVFVSDGDTLRLLRQQGVDYAQGYTVGRPQPVGELWPATGPGALPAG